MERDLEDLIKEGKEYINLASRHKSERFPDQGTPGYLISTQWLDKYKTYIFYRDIKSDTKPVLESDHCEKTHPGVISNEKDLLETGDRYLKGTGKAKEFESEVLDTYLQSNSREGYDFEIYNQELWDFLSSRYTADTTIKRYYQKASYGYLTECEVRFVVLPVIILNADDMLNGKLPSLTGESYIQMSKKSNFSTLKKRIVDILEAQG